MEKGGKRERQGVENYWGSCCEVVVQGVLKFQDSFCYRVWIYTVKILLAISFPISPSP
jgi:hypothetical protein